MKSVTITLTRYAEPDALVREVIARACAQRGVSGEVLFIEQNPAGSISETDFPDANLPLRIIRRALPGLSHARNLALDEARAPLVLFLDADALAEPDWAARLAEALDAPGCAIAASRILPGWPGAPPAWAAAQVVRDQYSLLDLGSESAPGTRIVGAAFGLDMAKLPRDLRFDVNLGRREGKLFGGEETDFCRRAAEAGAGIAYVGGAVVTHLVQPERMRLGWILKRLFYAGLGRATAGGAPNPTARPNLADWLWLPLILPPYAAGWLRAKLGRLTAKP